MTNAEFLDSLATETVQERLAELDRIPAKDVIAMYTPYRMCDSDLGEWLSALSLSQLWHLRNRHNWAAEIVFEKMTPPLQRFARNCNARFPDELVQDTWTKASMLTSMPDNLAAWLFKVLRHKVFSAYRKKDASQPSLQSLEDAGRQFGVDPTELGRLLTGELETDLEECIAKLNPEEQLVIRSRYWDDLSFAGIADAQGSTPGAQMARVYRALEKLEKCMTRRKGDRP